MNQGKRETKTTRALPKIHIDGAICLRQVASDTIGSGSAEAEDA
jgi:hypothetical protein